MEKKPLDEALRSHNRFQIEGTQFPPTTASQKISAQGTLTDLDLFHPNEYNLQFPSLKNPKKMTLSANNPPSKLL